MTDDYRSDNTPRTSQGSGGTTASSPAAERPKPLAPNEFARQLSQTALTIHAASYYRGRPCLSIADSIERATILIAASGSARSYERYQRYVGMHQSAMDGQQSPLTGIELGISARETERFMDYEREAVQMEVEAATRLQTKLDS